MVVPDAAITTPHEVLTKPFIISDLAGKVTEMI